MELSDFRKFLTDFSTEKDYAAKSISMEFPSIRFTKELDGIVALYDFAQHQMRGWNSLEQNPPVEFTLISAYYQDLVNKIEDFVLLHAQKNRENRTQEWDKILKTVQRHADRPFLYESTEVDFLLDIYRLQPECFTGAYRFLTGELINISLTHPATFCGYNLAYEFRMKSGESVFSRHQAESRSIDRLKDELAGYVSESSRKIKELSHEKDELFEKWFGSTKNTYEQFSATCTENLQELENRYREKLKLEVPAKYWEERARKLKKQGWLCLGVFILFILVLFFSLKKILVTTPETIFTSWFDGDIGGAVRWTMLFATLVAFMAYALRAVSKVMFSSFHLARDCEERHALTYFYLSLLESNSVDDKDRQMIMQSLFSRADTGLLKEDSAPTMPSELFGKIVSHNER